MSTVGGYLEYLGGGGGYYEYRAGGNLRYRYSNGPPGTVWSVIHVWDPPLKQLASQQQIHWHYVGLRMGPI